MIVRKALVEHQKIYRVKLGYANMTPRVLRQCATSGALTLSGRGKAHLMGRLCMENDIVAANVSLPEGTEAGDLPIFVTLADMTGACLMYLVADNPTLEPGMAAPANFARWKDFPVSQSSHHGGPCCDIARHWFRGMDFAQINGGDAMSGPRLIRQKIDWGPSQWPLHGARRSVAA